MQICGRVTDKAALCVLRQHVFRKGAEQTSSCSRRRRRRKQKLQNKTKRGWTAAVTAVIQQVIRRLEDKGRGHGWLEAQIRRTAPR